MELGDSLFQVQAEAGSLIWRDPQSYIGDYLRIPAAGAEARKTRLTLKTAAGEFDDPRVDPLTARLTVEPRWLVVPAAGQTLTDTTTTPSTTRERAVGVYSTSVHPAGTTITIPQSQHQLAASRALSVTVTEIATSDVVFPDVYVSTAGDITITFATAVTANSYCFTVMG